MNEFLLLAVIMIYLAISYWPTPKEHEVYDQKISGPLRVLRELRG